MTFSGPRWAGLAALMVLGIWGSGCEKARHLQDHKTVLERVRKKATAPVSPRAFRIKRGLAPADAVKVTYAGRHFVVPKRTDAISRYPCSGCHKTPITRKGKSLPHSHAFLATHGQSALKLKHAQPGVLSCRSCHDRSNLQWLKTPAGRRVSFTQSHLLCASCHQRQTKDWAGGAHGKRIKRWFGQRAIYTCTQCHNPHQPLQRFGKRWPKAYFTLPGQRPNNVRHRRKPR